MNKPFAVIYMDRSGTKRPGESRQVIERYATHQEYKDRLRILWDGGDHPEARATFANRVNEPRRWWA